jgi:hypothetical protein
MEINGVKFEFTEDGEIKVTNFGDIKFKMRFVDPKNEYTGYSNDLFNKYVWVKSNMSMWNNSPKIMEVVLESEKKENRVRVDFKNKVFEDLTIDEDHLSDQKERSISIIISTYKTFEMLKNVLTDFKKQLDILPNVKYEILVGIDGCYDTIDYISKLTNTDNIKFYFSKENVGPYFIFNSLSNIAQYDNLLFFGADDIPKPHMVKTILMYLEKYELVRFHFTEMYCGIDPDLNPKNGIGIGAFSIRRNTFLDMCGYYTWRTSADAEFRMRANSKNVKEIILDDILMYYRIGSGEVQLTRNSFSGYGSKLRDIYQGIVMLKQLEDKYENPETLKTVPLIRVY